MFRSLGRISWDTCVSLLVEQVVFSFHYEFSNSSGKSSKTLVNLQGLFLLLPIKNYISLIFFGRSKHKIQHISIYAENIYIKNSKRLPKYVKTKQKTTAFQRKYKVYIICTPKCDTFGNSFFPLLSIMECYKLNRWLMSYFLHPPLHSTLIVFASFRNLVNVLHDYQLIQVGSSPQMVSTLVLPFFCLDGIELGFL